MTPPRAAGLAGSPAGALGEAPRFRPAPSLLALQLAGALRRLSAPSVGPRLVDGRCVEGRFDERRPSLLTRATDGTPEGAGARARLPRGTGTRCSDACGARSNRVHTPEPTSARPHPATKRTYPGPMTDEERAIESPRYAA